ncbi:MAG: hypothetical protein ABEJ70_00095 [Halobacteriaceae archaeon]
MADDDTHVHRAGEMGGARPASGDGLDARQSWGLVVALLVCLVGFPVAILVWPPTFLPFHDAYLALAMVPAVLFGLVGVWLAGRS